MEKKAKIAFLTFYSGEVYRGVETYVHELANNLVDLGHDITVFQNGPKLKNSKYKTISIGLPLDWNQKGIEGRFLGIPFTDYYARLVGKFTLKVLPKIDSDIDILITTNGSLQVLFGRIWSLLKRKKLVVAGQSGPGMDDRWNLWCFPNTFIGLTKHHCEWAHNANPFVRVEKIPNGVDLAKFNPKEKSIKVDLPYPIILSVGALEPGKRLDLIIKAVAKTSASLLLVGRGKLEKELTELGNNLLKNRFKIISLPFDQMPNVYPACDVFTYPTVPWESFGIVLVEAMASGLPVVATDDPIRAEIVGDAGILVDPTDSDKYAQALESALNKNWGAMPRKQADKFSWEEIAKKYESIFSQIIK